MPRRSTHLSSIPTPIPYRDARFTVRDGRVLAYAEFGEPSGKPVFWFHGTPGARRQIPPDAPALAREHGFRIIAVERPGIGDSTHHPRRTLLSWAQDIEELANALGLEKFAAVGMSGGGPYVLACAHEMPDRVVAGVSLGGVGPTDGSDGAPGFPRVRKLLMRAFATARAPLSVTLSAAVQPLRPYASQCFDLYARFGPQEDRAVFERPEIKAMLTEDLTAGCKSGLHAVVYDIALFSKPWQFSPRDIRVPIRFWHGAADTIVPISHSQHLAELVEDSELFILPGLGHFAGFMSAPAVLSDLAAVWARRMGNGVR